ncbi:SDR family NAD(P)-dependent oxidoreductase [Caulobacter sp. 17J80-11]|uniref:NAD-dependent epimerase/dehydratase family protein n=1 Tax=Caulobacter sp. 17J80-11 TaxID=2763502 RepID=UPI001653E6C8|nr:SDR family NAD(P)-dependent oxidoreductase [Caulobacter sp. 17J80-11]
MAETILITGGAGFIGRRVARLLLERGDRVRVLDSLVEQVHGGVERPAELPAEVDLHVGDVRDENAVVAALRGVDAVIHLAAEVGVGQSMYEVDRYVSGNDYGTAVLLQQLIQKPVRRIVTASSMSIYGEGLYRTADGAVLETVDRRRPGPGAWEPLDADGRPLQPLPTPEWKRPDLVSVYALGKYVQERLTLTLAPAYGMEGVALRLFNVYGPGQALSNPYTGVLAIFAGRLLNKQRPLVFEDGGQRRDFVYVDDVARAFVTALDHPDAPGNVFNIGAGNSVSVAEVGERLARAMGLDIQPEITGQARAGDIRHCFSDASRAREVLGFTARRDFDEGLVELVEWVARQSAEDRVQDARRELQARGLVA